MRSLTVSRRSFLQTAAGGALGVAAGLGATGRAFAADLTVGIVYVGARDDFGWNQAHAVAAEALKQVPGVKVVEEENVPETDACAKTMESMINLDGAGLILATSFGYYTPFVVDLAKKYPKVEFRHAAPLVEQGQGPEERRQLFRLSQPGALRERRRRRPLAPSRTRSASSPPSRSPACLSNINSVLLGARKTNPKATVQVIFTGDWSMPVREAEAANALVDAGCDVITCHVDGPKVVIETGRKARREDLRPQRQPGAAGAQGLHHRRRIQVGDDLQGLCGGPRRRASRCRTSPPAATRSTSCRTRRSAPAPPRPQKAAATAAIADLKAKKPIYVGPLKDNKGKVVIDKTYDNLDPFLDKMDYLLEGVVGSIT